ncbi:outer membrane receptor protein involved in Fe transport [Taibaiella chishuiensis]|uniref:Outer membrane receptor protein involved in Fe transport n=2 Tax=Taibaiella chishuiensis TaxID=1434707 RepID=A0A2P8D6I9_9BACT|nr:outer membrane receptor protein involved in Fe transport [Taibaiella chishuiensis]
MYWNIRLLLFLGCMSSVFFVTAQTATVTGTVTDEYGRALYQVSVIQSGTDNGVLTDTAGVYTLTIPSGKKTPMRASSLGYENEPFSVPAQSNGNTVTRNITLHTLANVITEVEVKDQRFRNEAGTLQINTNKVNELPSTIGGIEGLLKILVGSNNELTSQYTVRGGNFDENLVYVNDFEIYRPFLVRSGQQEGLSFVNSDLVSGVNFSVGGFQARYGDKMSSVLDVTYKRPKQFGGSVMLSLLGAQAHIEGASRNKKLTYLIGARQKSNQYLLQSQPTKGQYNPSFTDIQALVNYRFSDKWELEAIANYARNRFNFEPEKSEAAFGLANEAYKLETFFTGQERDQFDSRFAGLSLAFKPNEKTKLKLLASAYQTNEYETYDIMGEYAFYALETDLGKASFGQKKYALGTGIIHDFARNYLTANVGTVALRGSHSANKHFFQWGADATRVHVDDQLLEWQRRDSAGFSQPYDPNAIKMAKSYRSTNEIDYTRLSAFIQDNILLSDNATLNLGVRGVYTSQNEEMVISPRAQFSFKPEWKKDVVFRVATGLYAQPAFYREMRDMEGNLNTALKAQKSYHAAAGLDYNFKMWGDRPFKLTVEAYYKQLWDLVPYEYDNVRIRYFANNNAKGYAYGGEVRLFGDLVKDAESWVSVGFLKTENKIIDPTTGEYTGYLPRPTDQRLNFGMFFSDYLPRNKNFKMYLNLMYATGLPFSPPGRSLNPAYTRRIPDYKRADIGFSALLLDGTKKNRPAYSFFSRFQSVWMSLEVFNLLGIENTLSYQWIQDYSSDKTFAVPNRLTSRLLNVKIAAKF